MFTRVASQTAALYSDRKTKSSILVAASIGLKLLQGDGENHNSFVTTGCGVKNVTSLSEELSSPLLGLNSGLLGSLLFSELLGSLGFLCSFFLFGSLFGKLLFLFLLGLEVGNILLLDILLEGINVLLGEWEYGGGELALLIFFIG